MTSTTPLLRARLREAQNALATDLGAQLATRLAAALADSGTEGAHTFTFTTIKNNVGTMRPRAVRVTDADGNDLGPTARRNVIDALEAAGGLAVEWWHLVGTADLGHTHTISPTPPAPPAPHATPVEYDSTGSDLRGREGQEVEVAPGVWLQLLHAETDVHGTLGGDPGDIVCSFPGDSRAFAADEPVRWRPGPHNSATLSRNEPSNADDIPKDLLPRAVKAVALTENVSRRNAGNLLRGRGGPLSRETWDIIAAYQTGFVTARAVLTLMQAEPSPHLSATLGPDDLIVHLSPTRTMHVSASGDRWNSVRVHDTSTNFTVQGPTGLHASHRDPLSVARQLWRLAESARDANSLMSAPQARTNLAEVRARFDLADIGPSTARLYLSALVANQWPATPAAAPTFTGSASGERAESGYSSHCDRCERFGHVLAHPDLGCGDVGCTRAHDEAPAETMWMLDSPGFSWVTPDEDRCRTVAADENRRGNHIRGIAKVTVPAADAAAFRAALANGSADDHPLIDDADAGRYPLEWEPWCSCFHTGDDPGPDCTPTDAAPTA